MSARSARAQHVLRPPPREALVAFERQKALHEGRVFSSRRTRLQWGLSVLPS